ncbi:unnamed protein product, partial [Medioppia subpectinata]
FVTNSNLIRHKNSIHSNVRFICDFNECHKSFSRKGDLFQHKSCVHLNEWKFKCNEKNCGKIFTTNQTLILHKRIHSGEKPFICDINDCNKSFTDKNNLFRHKSCVHLNESKFKCNEENCGKSFRQKSNLKEHMRRHLNIKLHKCIHNNCNQRFVTRSELRLHVKLHGCAESPPARLNLIKRRVYYTSSFIMSKLNAMKSLCEIIDKIQCILNTNNSVLCEAIECENNDYFSINQTIDCNSCKISDKMLNNCHIITKSDDHLHCFPQAKNHNHLIGQESFDLHTKQFKCDFNNCNKSYKQKCHLNRHKNIHLNVRFICDFNECHQTFSQKQDLFRHKSCVHLNERKFKCNEENCDKKFNTKYKLNSHKRIHSGEKPYKYLWSLSDHKKRCHLNIK